MRYLYNVNKSYVLKQSLGVTGIDEVGKRLITISDKLHQMGFSKSQVQEHNENVAME